MMTNSALSVPARHGVGLVLSGGGARGAYEVGVVRRLAEENIPVSAVAGTSIGALNGAVVAAAPSLSEAAARLDLIWRELTDREVHSRDGAGLKAATVALQLLVAFSPGRKVELLQRLHELFRTGSDSRWSIARYNAQNPDDTWLSSLLGLDPAVFDADRLSALFEGQVSAAELETGLPFWVSIMPSEGALLDFGAALRGALGLGGPARTIAMHVQALPAAERMSAVLASAALPFIFEAQLIGGRRYVDGGLTGWRELVGNTPMKPLHDAGRCNVAIVVHLSQGSLFDRSLFPELSVVEIRPRSSTVHQGSVRDLLSFEGDSLRRWIEQGYQDCGHYISQLREMSDLQAARREADIALGDAMQRLESAGRLLKRRTDD